jgi:hypothetical protein
MYSYEMSKGKTGGFELSDAEWAAFREALSATPEIRDGRLSERALARFCIIKVLTERGFLARDASLAPEPHPPPRPKGRSGEHLIPRSRVDRSITYEYQFRTIPHRAKGGPDVFGRRTWNSSRRLPA